MECGRTSFQRAGLTNKHHPSRHENHAKEN
jgi:hypothetical protein